MSRKMVVRMTGLATLTNGQSASALLVAIGAGPCADRKLHQQPDPTENSPMITAPLIPSYGASWCARTPSRALPEVTPLAGTWPCENVWRALTQNYLVAEWLSETDFKAEPGHEFVLQAGWGTVACKVLAVEPYQTLSYSWQAQGLDSIVTWTLTGHAPSYGTIQIWRRPGASLSRSDRRLERVSRQAFDILTPGRQRGYLLHISDARQSETRLRRIANVRSRILQGKRLNNR